jgi:uncharacterized membrane protein
MVLSAPPRQCSMAAAGSYASNPALRRDAMPFSTPDFIALFLFVAAWAGYAAQVEFLPKKTRSLNETMNHYRLVWMRRMLAREARMVDMQVMATLVNGTAFFASTSLLAIGGALTVLRSPEEILNVLATMPFGTPTTRLSWEIKSVGLAVIFVYAFFKFAWSYRLFNYVAILLGAMPFECDKDTPEAESHVQRTARLFEAAGRHFNHGQRAIFFALGYLGWFVSPFVLIAATAAVVFVMWFRQFKSDARRAMDL